MPAPNSLDSFLGESVTQKDRILRLFVRALNEAAPLPEPQILALTTRLSRPGLSDTEIRNATRLFADLPADLRQAAKAASQRLAKAARVGAIPDGGDTVKPQRVKKPMTPKWSPEPD